MVLPTRAWPLKLVAMIELPWGVQCGERQRLSQELLRATSQADLDGDMNAWHLRWVFWKVWRRCARTGKLAKEVWYFLSDVIDMWMGGLPGDGAQITKSNNPSSTNNEN